MVVEVVIGSLDTLAISGPMGSAVGNGIHLPPGAATRSLPFLLSARRTQRCARGVRRDGERLVEVLVQPAAQSRVGFPTAVGWTGLLVARGAWVSAQVGGEKIQPQDALESN